jgi:hypothetical protein
MRLLEMATSPSKRDTSIDGSIIFSLVQQAILLILGGLTLDDGTTLRTVLCAVFVYWIALFIVVALRHSRFTSGDRIFIRWGFLILWIMTLFFMGLIWHLRSR